MDFSFMGRGDLEHEAFLAIKDDMREGTLNRRRFQRNRKFSIVLFAKKKI